MENKGMNLASLNLSMRAIIVGVGIVYSCVLCGCGSGERVYHLSGNVTFKGQPVPEGHIIFEPDSTKGNTGSPGRSKIIEGKYDTNGPDGMGIVGGPHVIRIVGMDGKIQGATQGEVGLPGMLFPQYNVSEDLPKEDGTKDFDVPANR